MWHFAECAIQGRGHIKSGIPCQDKTMVRHKDDTFVITLADGAGSARYSHFGAENITNSVVDIMPTQFDYYFSEPNAHKVTSDIYQRYLKNLTQLAEELQCPIKELASTLLFVVVKNNQFILGHIGDGIIGYIKENQLKIASFPNNGEFSNETSFATASNASNQMNIIKGELNGISGFVLMSDGTAESLYNKREKKLATVIKKIANLSILLPKENIDSILSSSFQKSVIQATLDDCSMVLMCLNSLNFNGFLHCSFRQKCQILELSRRHQKLRAYRYSELLKFMRQSRTRLELYKFISEIGVRKKHLDKHLQRLMKLSLIELKDGRYASLISF